MTSQVNLRSHYFDYIAIINDNDEDTEDDKFDFQGIQELKPPSSAVIKQSGKF